MRWPILVAMLVSGAARAQPADCVPEPGPTATIPLDLQLRGLPGVPHFLSGYLGADVPAAPPGGTVCGAAPLPPSSDVLAGPPGDVLAGPPGDVLHGPRAGDLLRGPRPSVEVTLPGQRR
jgi:hypothetical protein